MRVLAQCSILLLAVCFATAEIKNKGWWKNTVFYQIYPWSFKDSNGDGIGDLNGITSKLNHFVDAGVKGIWLSPIYTSPMIDFGYDISNFTDIDPRFGTLADFERLTAAAHKLGLKVVLDLVPNHSSDQHEWFKKSIAGDEKYKDYYIWRNGPNNDNKSPPNNWISVFSKSAWQYNETRQSFYFHQFEYRQPDLNYSNPAVRKEMEDVMTFWLDNGADGFRIDAVPHLFEADHLHDEPRSNATGADSDDYNYLEHIYTKDDPRTYELVASWRKVLDDYADKHNQDEKVMMTEAYTSLANTTKFYKYGSNVPFNFKFITDIKADSQPNDFRNLIRAWIESTPAYQVPNWVMGNHDRRRIANRFPGRDDQMTMLAMILPGIAVTYYGEEIGMVDKTDISWEDTQDPQACNAGQEKYKDRSRDPNRTPFQWDDTANAGFSNATKTWLPVHENFKQVNLAKQKADSESHYKVYQELIKLRSLDALRTGILKTNTLAGGSVLEIIREAPNQSVILLINFKDDADTTVNLTQQTTFYDNTTVRIASVGSDVKAGADVNYKQVKIPAKASLVLTSIKS